MHVTRLIFSSVRLMLTETISLLAIQLSLRVEVSHNALLCLTEDK